MVHVSRLFCNMQRDGEQLKKLLDDAGVKVQDFADKMGVHRNTVTRMFTAHPIKPSVLEAAGKIPGVTITDYFPRLKAKQSQAGPAPMVQGVDASYGADGAPTLRECQVQLVKWQQLAYDNLVKYNKLLEEHNQLLRRRLQGGGAGEHSNHVPDMSHV